MSKQSPTPISRCSAGFTLLELLLVVVILSSAAFMMMGSVEDNAGQVRYEDTRNRLEAIRTAILGPSVGSTLWEKGVLAGFVADNGRLPENIDVLVTRANYGAYAEFGPVSPVFDRTPDIDGFNDGIDEIRLENPEYRLMKGHRGSYLFGAANEEYRDGWGTKGTPDFAENHGWNVDTNDHGFAVESYGMDGINSPSSVVYEQDMPMSPSISSNDWQVQVFSVDLRNLRTAEVDFSAAPVLAALLVYVNGSDANWRRFSTTLFSGSIPAGDSVSLSFQPSNTPVVPPIGEHLLVLVSDPDGTLNSGDDTPDVSTVYNSITGETSATPYYIAERIKFYPRTGVPNMVLEIR